MARGVTGRDKVIKFEGCYHGHSDAMLVAAGSGALTQGEPDSAGRDPRRGGRYADCPVHDLASVEALLDANRAQVRAIIVEPVAANMGVVPPGKGFLEGLRRLCDAHGCLLIFDEVITGFRLARGGAQEYFGVRADLVTFGKIIGGGMPVGAYAGPRCIMEKVAPTGPIYQAGTLGQSGRHGGRYKQLEILQANPGYYRDVERKAQAMARSLRESAKKHGVPMTVISAARCCAPTLRRAGAHVCGHAEV